MKLLYLPFYRLSKLVSYLSVIKAINCLKLIVSYLFPFKRLQKIQNIYPLFISIDTTNFCNLHCPECPVGRSKINNIDKTTFNYEWYKQLIEELKPTLLHVILYFQGEPFLNIQLVELIKYAHDARIYTSTSTNGQFLSKKSAGKIVMSGLDKLIVSIDGTTQEVYEKYREGGNLQKAIDGIKYLIEWKKAMNSITPLVEIQFLVLKTNEHQMKEMQKLAKSLRVDRLTFKSAQLYNYENGNELLTTKNCFARYKITKQGKYILKESQPNRCWRSWSGAVINVKGEVLPCCFDKSSEHSFGNIRSNSFLNCWQSNKATDFKSKIMNNRKQFEMCRNCTR